MSLVFAGHLILFSFLLQVAALGFVVTLAGFFSFSQNLLVDGFVILPNIPLPELLPMPPSDNGV